MTDFERNDNDAVACYILSQKQSIAMIAKIMGKSEKEVNQLVERGERIFKAREGGKKKA